MANSIESQEEGGVFKHGRSENVFPTARLTSPQKASGQVATSLVPRTDGALQTLTVSHRRKFYFHRRSQGANESIAKYIAELQQLATNCKFGE